MSLFTVIDCETTDKLPTKAIPLCVSYITFKTSVMDIVDSGTLFFYKEGIPWSTEAESIHGLSKQFLQQFESEYYENLRKLFKVTYMGNLVGQNIKAYDYVVLDRFLSINDYPPISPYSLYDTMYALGKRTKLSTIAETLNISMELIKSFSKTVFKDSKLDSKLDYHNSEFDTVATMFIYFKLLNKRGT